MVSRFTRQKTMNLRGFFVFSYEPRAMGFDRYGESLRVYEIKELSPERYAEELVGEIKPDFRKGLHGTHHLSTDGTTTVVDHASAALVL